MLAATVPYDADRARDLATAVSQIVPVLLLAALAVPLLQQRDDKEASEKRATRHLVATVSLIGWSALTEYIALYGVYYRLTPKDVHFLVVAFMLTSLFAGGRVLMPILEHYADTVGWSERWLWTWTVSGAVLVFVLAIIGIG